MKFKKLIAFSLISMMALSLMACGGQKVDENQTQTGNPWEASVSGDGSFEAVQKAGKIVVGLDEAYPPMGYRDPKTNEIIGFDIDMAKEIGKRIGVEFEFSPQDWNAIIPSLVSKRIDAVISGMNMQDDRIDAVNFVPYGLSEQLVLVKNDNPKLKDLKTLDDFKNLVIGTQLGGTAEKELVARGFEEGKNLKLYKSYPEVDLDLDNGRIDAIAIDNYGAKRFTDTGNYTEVLSIGAGEKAGNYGMTNFIGIAIRKTDGDLQLKIQEAMDEMLVDGTMKDISMKWLSRDITESLVADAKARQEAKK